MTFEISDTIAKGPDVISHTRICPFCKKHLIVLGNAWACQHCGLVIYS